MADTTKITCSRCRGKGYRETHVVYAGVPGTCFKCAGLGEVYRDKFYARFGVGRTFFGVTNRRFLNPNNPNNGVFKSICVDRDLDKDHGYALDGKFCNTWDGRVSFKPITEEQARKFWLRHGDSPVRLEERTSESDNARYAERAANNAARTAKAAE